MTTVLSTVWDLLNTNFISSVLGGLLTAGIFWRFVEKEVKDLIEFEQKKRLSKRFVEELLFNLLIATKIVEQEQEYITNNSFTFLKYETSNIDNFLQTEPLDLKKEFYINARAMSAVAFKKDNRLIDIFWFTPDSTETDRRNYKRALLDNAKNNIKNINELLSDPSFILEAQKIGIADPSDEILRRNR